MMIYFAVKRVNANQMINMPISAKTVKKQPHINPYARLQVQSNSSVSSSALGCSSSVVALGGIMVVVVEVEVGVGVGVGVGIVVGVGVDVGVVVGVGVGAGVEGGG